VDRVREFEDFVRARGVRLLRLALVLTGEQHDAEDLAQEALVRMQSKWGKVASAENQDAYARRILVNLYLSGKRRACVTPVRDDFADSQQSDPAELVGNKDLLRRALSRLPDRQRTAVVLRYYEEVSTPEISAIMGITESSVRSALSRGLESLRSSIQMGGMETTDEVVREGTCARTDSDCRRNGPRRPSAPVVSD
jgi:RNA polymerase sigma-70 factor (sigma-E family)